MTPDPMLHALRHRQRAKLLLLVKIFPQPVKHLLVLSTAILGVAATGYNSPLSLGEHGSARHFGGGCARCGHQPQSSSHLPQPMAAALRPSPPTVRSPRRPMKDCVHFSSDIRSLSSPDSHHVPPGGWHEAPSDSVEHFKGLGDLSDTMQAQLFRSSSSTSPIPSPSSIFAQH